MTKRQELDILDETIAKLGPDSYLGPWLASVASEVERSVRSDYFPTVSVKETQLSCAKMKDEAKAWADAVMEDAKRFDLKRRENVKGATNDAIEYAIEKLRTMKI